MMRLFLITLVLMLAGCESIPPVEKTEAGGTKSSETQPGKSAEKAFLDALEACQAAKVQTLVGRLADADTVTQARGQSGAKSVRVLGPHDAMTMDFLSDRLNIEIDAAGVITRLYCG